MFVLNSLSSISALRNRHSRESEPPVETAISGISPSILVRGNRMAAAGNGVFVQARTLPIGICARHLPVRITSDTLDPAGMFFSVKLPSAAVDVATNGWPDGAVLQ